MKRLLLLSSGLGYIKKFIGREPARIRMLFIPTAGNLDDNAWWIDKDRDVFSKMGFQITELDIANASMTEMQNAMGTIDIVYIAGGNTFYLLKQLRVSGFDKILTSFVNSGGLYAGASAGALVAGADIGSIASIDKPEKVKGLSSTKGLGFINIVPIPHYDKKTKTQKIEEIKAKYNDVFELVVLTDNQAILVTGKEWRVVTSKKSQLELDWFNKNN